MDRAESIPFDQYQRYGVVARAINALRKSNDPLNILEVGANSHKLLGKLLPNDHIIYLDREIPSEMIWQKDILVGDATELTLLDESFDVVVALDVFEHIKNDRREAFLRHTCRIARLITIIGAPFDSPSVVEAEREVIAFWDSLFSHPYRWLVEHAENGLPSLDLTSKTLSSMGYHLHILQHGDIRLWKEFIKGHFSEVCVGALKPVLSILYKYYEDVLFEQDFCSTETYRKFIFCSRDPLIVENIKAVFKSLENKPSPEVRHYLPMQLLKAIPAIAIERAKLNQATRDSEEQIGYKEEQIKNKNVQIAQQEQRVVELIHEAAELRRSTSWRITQPLRFVGRVISRSRLYCSVVLQNGLQEGWGGLNKAIHLYQREGLVALVRRFRKMVELSRLNKASGWGLHIGNDYDEWVHKYDTIDVKSRAEILKVIGNQPTGPLISVLMPVYNPPLEMLKESINSVQAQLYQNWELCIADDASTKAGVHELLQEFADGDSRIKIEYRKKNGHISAATNTALALASGEYIALLDNDDVLRESALFWVADAIRVNPAAGLIYSDEDKIEESGQRCEPYFKPDWNPDLFLSQNMICHLGVYRTTLVRKLGGFRIGFEGAQDYDLALRCVEQIEPKQIVHIPRILYHWRKHAGSTAHAGAVKNYALLAGRNAINDHFLRVNVKATAELLDFGGYRVRYDIPSPMPLVSLIIPTRNGLNLIRQCIESIISLTTYEHYEILIVDNNSDDPNTLAYFASLAGDNRIRILRDERPFNYSALNNAATLQARGEYIALINNDIEVISSEWLTEMTSLARQPGVAAVGARLWYPNDTLQHGGCITGIGGVAGHSHKHLPRGRGGYFSRAKLTQTMTVVTAACLVIKRDIFLEVGGLDEVNLKVAFNDVDFCLRLQEAGYRNVWTPYAELYHHESASRGFEDTPEKQARFNNEVNYMKQRWGEKLLNDPAYNPNLTLEHEDFSYAWPPRVAL